MKKAPIKAKNESNSPLFASFLTLSGVFCNFFTRSTGCAKVSSIVLLILTTLCVNAQKNSVNISKNVYVKFDENGLVQIYSVQLGKKNHYFNSKFQNFSTQDYADEILLPESIDFSTTQFIYNWTKNISETWLIENNTIKRTIKVAKAPKIDNYTKTFNLQTFLDTDLDYFSNDLPTIFQEIDNKTTNDLIIDERIFSIQDKHCKQLLVTKNHDDINQQMTYHFDSAEIKFPIIFNQYIKINPTTKASFINKVAISGDYIVVSYTNSSIVRVYKKEKSRWKFFQEIKSKPSIGFGTTLAIEGNTIMISAPLENIKATHIDINLQKTGAVYFYTLKDNKWQFVSKLTDSKENTMEGHFGSSLYLQDKTLLVGAPDTLTSEKGENHNYKINNQQGAVFMYKKEKNTWIETASFFPDKKANESAFGKSVAIDNNTLLIGGNYIDKNHFHNSQRKSLLNQANIDFGQFYIYEYINNSWQQTKHIRLHDINRFKPRDSDNTFANSLDISNDIIVVSSPSKIWAIRGINNTKDEMDGFFDDSGSVFIFMKKENEWELNKKLKARFPAAWDHFGVSLRFKENTLIIGASGESSQTGKKRNCTVNSSGAAFIFNHGFTGWKQSNTFKSDAPKDLDEFAHTLDFDGNNAVFTTKNKIYVFSKIDNKWQRLEVYP